MQMEKISLGRRLARRLDIPAEALTDGPRITISGHDRVLVEGHRGLLEYADDRIAAAGAGCKILVKGQGLGLEAMSGRELVITGQLWAVELE
jgi:sporulation protein YqfC